MAKRPERSRKGVRREGREMSREDEIRVEKKTNDLKERRRGNGCRRKVRIV